MIDYHNPETETYREWFARFIDDNMKHNHVEAQIVKRLIRTLERRGDPIVSVFDGDEDVKVSTERDILEQVFNLDECRLYTKSAAFIFFVNGNEWDAICDYSLSIESIIEPVNEWIERKA